MEWQPRGLKKHPLRTLGVVLLLLILTTVIEVTEEAIYHSHSFRATTITGRGHTLEALPLDRTNEILRQHNALGRWQSLPEMFWAISVMILLYLRGLLTLQ